MNKVILVGRLTADPELKQTTSGVANCRFTVAVDRRVPNKETGEREADFITCVAWRKSAEFLAKYFTKGKMIVVEGTLRTDKYQDKNHEDVMHFTTEVMVDNIEFCGGKGEGGGSNTSQPTNTNASEPISSDEDVPF